MSPNTVIGIIGGYGWMGRALGLALLEQGIVPASQLVVSSRSGVSDVYRDWPGLRRVTDNRELAAVADVIVLSVRPEDLAGVDISVPGKLVISLLAMASLADIVGQVGSTRVVRAMPNAAAEIRRAYFPWCAGEDVTGSDRQLVQTLLASCGKAQELSSEQDLDYMTALSGAGPAYPALMAQAMLEHARSMGITDDIARAAVMEALVGGCLLLEGRDEEPGEMVKQLIAYNGTTAQGLKAMIDGGFDTLLQQALSASFRAACKR